MGGTVKKGNANRSKRKGTRRHTDADTTDTDTTHRRHRTPAERARRAAEGRWYDDTRPRPGALENISPPLPETH